MTEQRPVTKKLDIIIVYLAVLAVVFFAPMLMAPVLSPTVRALLRYVIYVIIAAPAIIACITGKRPVFATLGFSKEKPGRQLLLVAPVFAVTALIFIVIPLLLGVPKTMVLNRKYADTAALILQIIHLMVFVGFGEELIFRGYLFERLKAETHSAVWTVVLTAVAFGFLHFPSGGDIIQVLILSVFGLIYGFARLKFKRCSTLTLALAHGLHDTFILVLSCILL